MIESFWSKGIYPATRLCSTDGCFRKHSAKGICERCRGRIRQASDSVYVLSHRERSRMHSKRQRFLRLRNDPEFLKRQQDLAARRVSASLGNEFTKKNKRKVMTPIERRYNAAISSVKKRVRKKLSWDISLMDFVMLADQSCWYCGGIWPKTRYGIGLDRIDSSKGYSIDNVYPCCPTCNTVKNDKFNAKEAKVMIECVKIFRGTNQ